MSGRPAAASAREAPGIWVYNIRILIGNSYWLAVAPVAATQIVLFWSMATGVLVSAGRATQTIELLAPILAAFLCAHALAAEEDGVGELVFVRPVSIEKVLALRLCVMFAFVFAILTPAFVIFSRSTEGFSLGLTILAALPSALALSVLAMAVASVARNPILGFAAAGAFWALDVLIGGYFNPLITLHAYADSLFGRDMSEQWVLNKVVLTIVAGLLYVWHRRMLTRPPAPRRWAAALRAGAVVVAVLVLYSVSGAAYKVSYGVRHERALGHRARLWYQRQFRGYGPLPVAWMFGPAFVRYVEAELGRELPFGARGSGTLWTRVDVSSMQQIVARYPDSAWADNAQFEIASHVGRQELSEPWVVVAYEQGGTPRTAISITQDVERAADGYEALVDRYPGSPFAPLALAERAAIGLRLLDFATARAAYERLVRDYPDAPESCEAGMQLSAFYLGEGDSEEALRAGDVAAGVAPWDVKAEALLAAARAAHQGGDEAGARDRYGRALEAARDAVERATRGEKTPSRISKGALFAASNAVIAAAESAMEGRSAAPVPVSGSTAVVGRVVVAGGEARPVRVALGAKRSSNGLPSPFREGPAASAPVDVDGGFEFDALPSGVYNVVACAARVAPGEAAWRAQGVSLPARVGSDPVVLGDLTITSAPAPEVASPGAPARALSGRERRREGARRRFGRGGRGERGGRS